MFNIKFVAILVFLSPLAFVQASEGKKLFNEASCLQCHNQEDFGNEKSKIKMFKQLEARVQACQLAGDDGLFDDEVHGIAEYLNKDFYKLKE